MAANTGRTITRYVDFYVDDNGGTLRQIKINTISAVGLRCEEQDLTAFQDAVKGALPGQPEASIEIGGPFDTTTHGVLSGIVGGTTPLSLDVRFGIRQSWEEGEPQFGITSDASNGYLCFSYRVNSDLSFSARFNLAPGSAAPAWGTVAES